jgi:xanthine dehydrogenase accessory factor
MGPELYREIAALLERHAAVAVATVVRSSGSTPRHAGAKMIVLPDGSTRHTIGGGKFEGLVVEQALSMLRNGTTSCLRNFPFRPEGPDSFGSVCGGEAEVFVEVIAHAPRLIVVGAGHCGQALAQAAALLDFRIVMVDDRREYADPSRFADTRVEEVIDAGEDFRDLPETSDKDYVVLVSRSHLTDAAALRHLVERPLRYLGMIGSRRRVETVFQDLRSAGVSAEALERVHAPIGIELGAETPAEIAISILAEIVRVRRRGS